jgi:hypothetical protein
MDEVVVAAAVGTTAAAAAAVAAVEEVEAVTAVTAVAAAVSIVGAAKTVTGAEEVKKMSTTKWTVNSLEVLLV